MKKKLLFVRLSLISLIMAIGSYAYAAVVPLSGFYTIDTNQVTSATNFKGFTAAIDSLKLNGVSGPVVFMVAPGTYNRQVLISGTIPGASTVNTVTFDGTDPATTIITYAATLQNASHTVRLQDVKYVTFRNFTIRGSGATYGWPVHIMSSTSGSSNANGIKQCVVEITGSGVTSTGTAFCGIVANGSLTAPTTGMRIDSLEIDSNTVKYGYYGINLYTATGTTLTPGNEGRRNKVRNNKVYGTYNYGIFSYYNDGIEVSGNEVKFPRAGNGISISSPANFVSAERMIISGNKITGFTNYGIYIATVSNAAGNKGLIANNMIGGALRGITAYNIYLSTSSNWNICNNSFNHDVKSTTATVCCIYIPAVTIGINIFNNIFSETADGSVAVNIYAANAASIDSMDYNIFWKADMTDGKLLTIGTTSYDHTNFKVGAWNNANSIFANPGYASDSDLHIASSCNMGLSRSFITADIEGAIRGVNPVIGAHEVQQLTDNMMVLDVVSPAYPISSGSQDLVVKVQNLGSSVLSSFDITYRLDGGAAVTMPWTGSISPCATDNITFNGPYQFNMGEKHTVIVSSRIPNGMQDMDTRNDTLIKRLAIPLNGTYTIGQTPSAYFSSFNDALDRLYLGGVSGPVVLLVDAGTYKEQVVIIKEIKGLSAANTITFDGVNAADRILTWTPPSNTAALLPTLQISRSHIRIRNLTIRSDTTAFGIGIKVTSNDNDATNIHIKNNIINVMSVAASAGGIMLGGGGAGNALSSAKTDVGGGSKIDSVQVDSNSVTGGYYGIQMGGNSDSNYISYNHYYRYNTVKGSGLAGITVSEVAGLVIKGNKIGNVINFTNAASRGISLGNSNARTLAKTYVRVMPAGWDVRIEGNKVGVAKVGIEAASYINNPANRGMIVNNIVAYSPMNITGSGNFNIYHNSVMTVDETAFTLTRPAVADAAVGNVIKNNHFVVSSPTSLAVPFVVSDLVSLSTSGLVVDYNNYYRPDPAGDIISFGAFYRVDNFIGAGGYNLHAVYLNPEYASNDSSLVSGNPCISGEALSAVTADINNVPRNTPPDIGAYELPTNFATDIGMTLINPVAPFHPGTQDIHALIRNRGTNAITSFEVVYAFNSGFPVTRTWTGNLSTCDTVSVIFTGAEQIDLLSTENQQALSVYTRSPNNTIDLDMSNDSANLQIYTAMSGIYTIGGTTPSFATFTAARNALKQRGIIGPVVFNVRTGTYTEQVEFTQVTGVSEVNTITFRSETGNRSNVTLKFDATSATDNYVIRLTNAFYFNFRQMTIQSLNATNGRVIEFTGMAANDTIQDCNLVGVSTTNTTNAVAIICALTFKGRNIVIRNNTLQNGGMGIYMTGPLATVYTGPHVFENNLLQNVYYQNIYFQWTFDLKIRNNTITTTSVAANGAGIYINAGDGTLEITGNKMTGIIGQYGLFTTNCRGTEDARGLIANNAIAMKAGTGVVYGLYSASATGLRIYNNAVSVNTPNANAFAGYINYGGVGDTMNDIRNNIFAYNSTTSTGAAMYCNIVAAVEDFNRVDYNNLYSGAANLVGGGTVYTNLAAWKAGKAHVGFDQHSVSYNPGFTDPLTNLAPNPSNSAVYSINGRGIYLADVPADINGNLRPATYSQGATDIGAYEFTPASTTLAPLATVVGSIGHDATQVFTFAGDTVAKIKWDPLSSGNNIPASISVRQYSGVKPPVGDAGKYMYFYTDVDVPAGSYGYTLETYYRENWIGTITEKENLKMINKPKGQAWVYAGVSSGSNVTDTIRNILKDHAVDNLGYFTGTDVNNPLPVRLLNLSANKRNRDVVVSWSTAGELNSNLFEVERMRDGRWTAIGRVKAAGNSQSVKHYQFIDQQATANNQQPTAIYYRLRMVDRNGSFTYSKTVSVRIEGSRPASVSVYPNPFNNEVFINIEAETASTVKVEWMDITGKTITSNVYQSVAGTNVIDISTGDVLKAGIYFVSVEADGVRQVQKLVKQ